jgi:hypothetical protein
MSGNAAEWCWDSHIEDTDDEAVSGSRRVVRGGSWRSAADACKVTARAFKDAGYSGNDTGFRIAGTITDDGGTKGDGWEEDEDDSLPAFTGLSGTKWLWGQSLLEFGDTTVRFRGKTPDYTYTVTGGALVEGEDGGGNITVLGDFIINAERDTLEIVNYRNNDPASGTGELEGDSQHRYNAVFHRRNPEALTAEYLAELAVSTVVGTEWNVGGVGGGNNGDRFKNCQWIIFFTGSRVVNQSGDSTQTFVDKYTFNAAKRKGWIYFINDFIIRANWDTLHIPSYKVYGHTMDCARVW